MQLPIRTHCMQLFAWTHLHHFTPTIVLVVPTCQWLPNDIQCRQDSGVQLKHWKQSKHSTGVTKHRTSFLFQCLASFLKKRQVLITVQQVINECCFQERSAAALAGTAAGPALRRPVTVFPSVPWIFKVHGSALISSSIMFDHLQYVRNARMMEDAGVLRPWTRTAEYGRIEEQHKQNKVKIDRTSQKSNRFKLLMDVEVQTCIKGFAIGHYKTFKDVLSHLVTTPWEVNRRQPERRAESQANCRMFDTDVSQSQQSQLTITV